MTYECPFCREAIKLGDDCAIVQFVLASKNPKDGKYDCMVISQDDSILFHLECFHNTIEIEREKEE